MRIKFVCFSVVVSVLLISCGGKENPEEIVTEMVPTSMDDLNVVDKSVRDDHTLSNYLEAPVSHIHLDVEVDFNKQIVFGTATHTLENEAGALHASFDTKNLSIESVLVNGQEAQFEMGERDELLGTPLLVSIDTGVNQVAIKYSTTDSTEALDWLEPSKTAGKKHPYLFTQGQAILTRSWIPCMDTPGLRITYSANVKVPSHLMAVMSANNPLEKNNTGEYTFEMNQPIPSYLIALAVGDLAFAAIDERTGVYTEPSMIEACREELSEMDQMVDAAEQLYGEYAWERYDVIVLPPSFPFGGMENPRLTFATPTIIAGDKSLTALIAHELAHSWSGNLVTNSTWDDFWLNEGFTVYFERRIMEAVYGKDYADMLSLLGKQDLEKSIARLDTLDTHLKLRLKGRNPDDGMTDIAYEKGNFFLRMIEENVGREAFDGFLKGYFETHKFQTITTEDFLAYLTKHLIEPSGAEINIDEWVYGKGVPANCPVVVSQNFMDVETQLNSFIAMSDVMEIDPEDWSTHEWLHFIRNLKKKVNSNKASINHLEMLDRKFKLTESGNSEIAAIWFETSINAGYSKIDAKLEEFLIRVGRRKFLMPLYEALVKTEQGTKRAKEIYAKARSGYHYVSSSSIDALLSSES